MKKKSWQQKYAQAGCRKESAYTRVKLDATMNICDIPLDELYADRAESKKDIFFCTQALLLGLKTYSNGCSIVDRLLTNRQIVEKIDRELDRRLIAATLNDEAQRIG